MADDEGHGFRKKNNVDFQFYATVTFVRQFLLGEAPSGSDTLAWSGLVGMMAIHADEYGSSCHQSMFG